MKKTFVYTHINENTTSNTTFLYRVGLRKLQTASYIQLQIVLVKGLWIKKDLHISKYGNTN